MIIKAFPYLMIIMGIIGFFVNPQDLGPYPTNSLQQLLLVVLILPWWGKLLSILIGLFWILMSVQDKTPGTTTQTSEHIISKSPIKPKE